MTQTLELNKMGLTPMTEFEMMKADGGNLPWIFGLAYWIADNWDEIKSGANDALKEVRKNLNVKA